MAIIKKIKDLKPKAGENCYFADGACLIGDITLGNDCSVWFNAVLRGDVHFIRIGNRVNIQDCCCLHTLNNTAPVIIEDDVTIGHHVTLHGCTVRKNALVGMGSTILDYAEIGEGAIVAAGALVLQNTKIGAGELWGGVPAHFIKKVDPKLAASLNQTYARHYIENMSTYHEAAMQPAHTHICYTSEEVNQID